MVSFDSEAWPIGVPPPHLAGGQIRPVLRWLFRQRGRRHGSRRHTSALRSRTHGAGPPLEKEFRGEHHPRPASAHSRCLGVAALGPAPPCSCSATGLALARTVSDSVSNGSTTAEIIARTARRTVHRSSTEGAAMVGPQAGRLQGAHGIPRSSPPPVLQPVGLALVLLGLAGLLWRLATARVYAPPSEPAVLRTTPRAFILFSPSGDDRRAPVLNRPASAAADVELGEGTRRRPPCGHW